VAQPWAAGGSAQLPRSVLTVSAPSTTTDPVPRTDWLRATILRLAVTGVGLLALGLLLGLTLVGRHGGGPLQGWDNTVERWSISHRDGLVGVAKVIATWGDAALLGVLALAASVIWLAAARSLRGLVPLVAYLGGEGLVFLIREIVHRHRPPTADYPAPHAVSGVHETSYSFPSGHAVAVTAVLFALLGTLALARRQVWAWPVALVASCFVAFTRLVLGVHWFSDLAIGLALGIAWGSTVAVVGRWLPEKGFALRRPQP
jgi:membrane-associated phospholipid phosphatase